MRFFYAYDIPFPNRFAATIQITKTGRALRASGHSVTFGCGPASLGGGEPGDAPYRPIYPERPKHPALRPWILRHRTRAALRRERPDILLSRGETGMALANMTMPAGTRRILEFHKLRYLDQAEREAGRRLDPRDTAQGRLYRREARAFHSADGLMFLTPGLRDAAEEVFGTPRAPWVVVPSGTDTLCPKATREPDVDLIYVGKIERRKGVFLLLEAMHQLPGRNLRLIGDGADLHALRDRVRKDGLGERVDVAGYSPSDLIGAELARARIGTCLLPGDVDSVSHRFTSPMKLLEMMAIGMPILASDLPSVRNVCRDGIEAVLLPPNPHAIAAAAERLLAQPRLAARLGAAARARARDFSWERRAAAIAEFCATVRAGG